MKKKLCMAIATMLAIVTTAVPVFAAGLGTVSSTETATLDAGSLTSEQQDDVYGVEVTYTVDALGDVGAYIVVLVGADGSLLKAQATSFIAGTFASYGVDTESVDIDAGGTGKLTYTQSSPLLAAGTTLSMAGNENINSSCTVTGVKWLNADGKDVTTASSSSSSDTTDDKAATGDTADDSADASADTDDSSTAPDGGTAAADGGSDDAGVKTGDSTFAVILVVALVAAAGAGLTVYGRRKSAM